tara:strand:- start:128 stop:511 length:384 start_codon:yes stop_codon:yes gene_type:complete
MAKFKQLDVLKLADNESADIGDCFNSDGNEVNIGSNTAVLAGTSDPASAKGYCVNNNYIWEGDQAVDLVDARATTIDLEKIVSFCAFLNPDTGNDDLTKTEIITESSKKYVINETLENFMKLMATSV